MLLMANKRRVILFSIGILVFATVQPTMASADQLLVEPDFQSGYSRTLFNHWIDEDIDGCDTRAEVLIAEAVVKPKVGKKCVLTGGKWLSAYDGKSITKASDLEIDHVVPLAEAWRSGAWRWTEDQRQIFANDLADSRSLIAVSTSQKRLKGDKDVALWLPTRGVCAYITNWIAVKFRYSMSVDGAEASTLNKYLASCGITNINVVILPDFVVAKSPSAELSPTPTPTPSAVVKKMPELPKPILKSMDSTTFEIEIPEIAGWDFSLMKLTLNLTGAGAGDCKKETVIESLPFTLKCSGILAKEVWIVSLQGSGTYGKVDPTLAFSGYLSFDSFPKLGTVPTPTTPSPTATTPSPTATTPSPTTPPEPSSTASAPSSSGKLCWVNPYTRKDGTPVKGYYRKC